MSAALYRLGQWCFRRRRYVVAAWVLVIAVLAVVAVNVKQPTSNSVTIPGTESQQALNLLDQKFPGTGGAQAQVVFSVPASKSLTDAADRQAVEATLAELRKLPQVVDVTDPYQAGTVSKNGRIAYAVVAYPVAVADVTHQGPDRAARLRRPGQGGGDRRQLRRAGGPGQHEDRHRRHRRPDRLPRPVDRIRLGGGGPPAPLLGHRRCGCSPTWPSWRSPHGSASPAPRRSWPP